MSRRRPDPYAGYEPFALRVFVPAVMSAGLLFSLLTILRDAAAGRHHRGAHRRTAIAAAGVAADVLGSEPAPGARGLRPRRFYLLSGLGLAASAAYLVPGALLNYAHDGGYVSDIAWLLGTSAVVAALAAGAAAVALATWWRWPEPPPLVRRTIAATPLAAGPGSVAADGGGGADPALGAAATVSAVAFLALAVGVGAARSAFARFDRSLLDAVVGWDLPAAFEELAILGRTTVALPVALFVGIASVRCRALAGSWVVAVAASYGIDTFSKAVIERSRPAGPGPTVLDDSFPSGHVVQATLLAVVVPLALHQLTRRQWPGRVAGALLGAAAAVTALERVHSSDHWPTDVLGGALLGIAAGASVHWAVSHTGWHQACRGCVHQLDAAGRVRRAGERQRGGIIRLRPGTARWLQRLGRLGLATSIVALLVLARTHGLPTDPEGEGTIAAFEVPIQLALLALASLGGLLQWRWRVAGVTVVAVAAALLGLVASVEHPPWVALGVTAALGVPALLLWLAWQHHQRPSTVVVAAVIGVAVLTGQTVAAARIHDHFFGPAHPESTTPEVPVDRVEWAWTGDLRSDGVTVVARLAAHDRGRTVGLQLGDGARAVLAAEGTTDADGIVRLRASGLAPATEHDWSVVVDGHVDQGRGRGTFRTAPDGPASFTIAAGSCARTGSDGAVYDAIRAVDPLLYLATGDLHYGNLSATTPGPFLSAFGRVLTSPAQAALFRAVPVDYVWDDHDYGPNDADASSPGRAAAWAAYRQAAPHPPLPSDGPIYHASTIGRVRIVVTDTRSARTDDTMLGAEQQAWLLEELADADRWGLVVWVNPDPWIAPDDPARDDWGAHAEERRAIAEVIAAEGVDNLVMVSGDAHMVAIDDGTNSDFATDGGAGFPVLHAAALDRPGNVKGGPYSEGAFPGAGQFGVLRIDDDGERVTVELEGRDWTGAVLVRHTFTAG